MSETSLKQRIVTYPNQKYFALVVAESQVNEESKSEITSRALKLYYDTMAPEKKARLIEAASRISKNSY